MKEYDISIFIFRRDFRIEDNIGLINALKKSNYVVPIFILTPEQLINNQYKSNNCIQFMIESLEDLNINLKKYNSKIFYFFDTPHKIIAKILAKNKINAVFVNRDYTPYSQQRDEKIKEVCDKNNVVFESYEDYLLQPVGSIRTGQDTIYTKFTPFFNTAKKIKVNDVTKNNYKNFIPRTHKIMYEFKGNIHKFYELNENIAINGGRKNALKILNNIQHFKNYNKDRNTLKIPTTRLSAYIKFGCVSIREVYHKIKTKLGMSNDLIKQLYWREFYYNVGYFNSDKVKDQRNFKESYDKIPWITYDKATQEQKKQWKAWCNGQTGFPIVDAAMRQLNKTGFMENRGRLIVASFLVKDMFWSPYEGEKYFSQYLVDIDWLVNSASCGNWGWISGASVDTQPFFRVFSPYQQSIKYDTDCVYIKKWIPELKDVSTDHIHQWDKYYNQYPEISYPKPILDHSSSAKKTIEKYKKALYK